VNDFGNIDFDELIERLNLMADKLFSIRLADKGLENVAIVREGSVRHDFEGALFLGRSNHQFLEISGLFYGDLSLSSNH
jgi:hypothetical protein